MQDHHAVITFSGTRVSTNLRKIRIMHAEFMRPKKVSYAENDATYAFSRFVNAFSASWRNAAVENMRISWKL